MKKLFTSAFLFLIGITGFSQSQRTVLIEQGTSASCPPCAVQNTQFNVLLDANAAKAISIKYQMDYPGDDPMNAHNPTEATARFNTYYGGNGIPSAILDGNVYTGAPSTFTAAAINNRYSTPASFDIDLSYELTLQTITVNCTTNCTRADTGDFKLRIVVIEREILFDSAPSTNGETEFFNVMKKFLPNTNGIAMEDTFAIGETFTTTQTWNLANIYDLEQVAVIAFIQNDLTKEVMQAKLVENIPISPVPGILIDAVASSITGVDRFSCVSSITPSVTIQNYGSTPLTSCNVNYEINGTTGSIPWTGNLAFYQTGTVSLGTISYTPDNSNILNVTMSNPNGSNDQNETNNTKTFEIGYAGYASLNVTVEIRTDYYPGETSWEIREDNGTLVTQVQYVAGTADQFGGGGPDATTTKTHQVTLAANKCYSFKMFDSYGDGMGFTGGVTTAPPFGYKILNSTGAVIIEEQANSFNFGSETENAMRTDAASSIDDKNEFKAFNVFPNPATNTLNVEVSLEKSEAVNVEVFDILGQRVKFEQFNTVGSGVTTVPMNVSDLAAGTYTIRISSDSAESVKRFNVSK
jgi:hypothetical protein